MTSFISVLLLLVFTIGCFALPVIQKTNHIDSSSSVDPIIGHETTPQMVSSNMKSVSKNEKNEIEKLPSKQMLSNKQNSQISHLSNDKKTLENKSHASETLKPKREQTTDEHKILNTKHDNDKQNILEVTTVSMPPFTSTSSSVAPELYTTSSLLTPTEKYIGHLKDEKENENLHQDENENGNSHQDEKENKDLKHDEKLSEKDQKLKNSKLKPEDKLEDDANIPMARFDPNALKFLNYRDPNMQLEQNTEVVTNIPDTLTTIKNEEEKKQDEHESKPLNQGEESSHPEEEKSDH